MENENEAEYVEMIDDDSEATATVADVGDGGGEDGEQEDDVVVIGDGSGSSSSSRVSKKSQLDRVKGPWSPEEDAVLSRLVSNLGARNWSLIARGIPGRSGKSCRLRWCNQLDPAVKRNPFTEEEDHIILQAHTIHGNKWASIARLLHGRTDNAIKNHWNSTLRRRCIEPGKYKSESSNIIEDASAEKSKASSDETLSCGDVNSLKSVEGKDITSKETIDNDRYEGNIQRGGKSRIEIQCNPEVKDPPSLFRPRARSSAFSVYSPGDVVETSLPVARAVSFQGLLDQVPIPEAGINKLLQGAYGDRLIPHHCAHGCCTSLDEGKLQSSLLGPEFVDYAEPPSFPSHELATLAADISNVAWHKSGLESSSIRAIDNISNILPFTSSHLQMGYPEEVRRNNGLQLENSSSNLAGMLSDALCKLCR